jgi:hypothetical protein
MASTLGLYVKRWQRWAVAGLQDITVVFYRVTPEPVKITPFSGQLWIQRFRY